MDEVEYEYRKDRIHEYEYDVFLICPVRAASPEQKERMESYIATLEAQGLRVYYPARDTNQEDETGFRICQDNVTAIQKSKEVHIFFDPTSSGSKFDLGAAFASEKKLVIVNPEEVKQTEGKSFDNMVTEWSRLSMNLT